MKTVWRKPAARADGMDGFTLRSRIVPVRNRTMASQNRGTLCRSGSETVSAAILKTGVPLATTGTPTLPVRGWMV